MGGREKKFAFEIEISKKAEYEIKNICEYIEEENGNHINLILQTLRSAYSSSHYLL